MCAHRVQMFFLLSFCLVGAAVNGNPAFSQEESLKLPVKIDEANQHVVTNIFHLQFVKAEDAMKTVQSLFAESSPITLSVDARINALLVRADTQLMGQLEALLKVIDSQQPELRQVKTLPLDLNQSTNVLQSIRAFDLSSVEMAMTAEGGLILRGTKEDVAEAEELIKQIGLPQESKTQDISIQLIWLTERGGEDVSAFEGPVADQLKKRGFKPLSVLSELEVTTLTGGKCEARGAAGLGLIDSQIETRREGDRIVLSLQVEAQYMVEGQNENTRRQASNISFTTELTTPLDRWIVFGVAQRQTWLRADTSHARDLFLIRVNEQKPLEP